MGFVISYKLRTMLKEGTKRISCEKNLDRYMQINYNIPNLANVTRKKVR